MNTELTTVVWDVTAPRHLALARRADLMMAVTGLTVPRHVADPTEPTGTDILLQPWDSLSELAAAEHHFLTRSRRTGSMEDLDRSRRLAEIRMHPDLRVIDLIEQEQEDMDVLASRGFTKRMGFSLGLGSGERAVLAVAANRDWVAGLDDGAARAAAQEWGVPVMTTQDLLRAAADRLLVTRAEAEAINRTMIGDGFFGQQQLYP